MNFGWNLELSSIRILNVSPIFLPAAIFLIFTVFRIQLATYFFSLIELVEFNSFFFLTIRFEIKLKFSIKIGLFSSQILNIDPIVSIDRIYIKLLSIKKRKEHYCPILCMWYIFHSHIRSAFHTLNRSHRCCWQMLEVKYVGDNFWWWCHLPSPTSHSSIIWCWWSVDWNVTNKIFTKSLSVRIPVLASKQVLAFSTVDIKSDCQKGWTTFELEYSISVR